MTSPNYVTFIWSAYGFTAFAVAALIVRAWLDARTQAAALARLDADVPGPPRD